MNKRELLYEIDKFDEALQTHKYTEAYRVKEYLTKKPKILYGDE